ncbi:unnamed protein product [Camellia sinensis]
MVGVIYNNGNKGEVVDVFGNCVERECRNLVVAYSDIRIRTTSSHNIKRPTVASHSFAAASSDGVFSPSPSDGPQGDFRYRVCCCVGCSLG